MDRPDRNELVRMTRGRLLRLENRAGTLIRVREGEVWVTEQGGREDHILGAGQSLRLRRSGAAIVQAFKRSVITVSVPAPAGILHRLRDAVLAPLQPTADAN